ncbi:MAG: DNA mismatch repair endonuclease MutL [Alistipes sp.]|nr:DNA mismatch repair endonuclease MutL [Alistipes sp.]
MDRIKLLPEIVANQIAAGEVVNAPSNVVKEMMENSIDAGAKCVRVNYRNGGKDMIQIVDDGIGMSAMDARMAFDRHATSKIRSIEDVYQLHTFGFRGEALASIAAVAEVELRTRREEDELGTLTEISGGEFRSQTPVSCSKGSQFVVRNLFYNVPSRRKFIDGDNSRLASQIKSEFQRVALCNPEVEFELRQNDAPLYMLPPTNRRGRIIDIVGKHIRQNLLDVDFDTSVVRIEGFVGRPAAAKKRNNEQYLFVNGRYFYSQAMQRTIVRAYEKLIPEGCMPSYFIYLTVDPERVDVNVHPQKTTVKFADTDVILEILQAAIRETLAKTGAVPMMDFSGEGAVDIPVMGGGGLRRDYREPRTSTNTSYNPFMDEYIDPTAPMPDVPFTGFDVPYDNTPIKGVNQRAMESVAESFDFRPSAGGEVMASGSIMEFIDEEPAEEETLFDVVSSSMAIAEAPTFMECMTLCGGYAVAKYGAKSVFVSLQRAKERILFEEVLRSTMGGSVATQRMFFAEELQLSLAEYELMEEHATEFAALGFEVEYRGEGTISVIGRPAILDMATPLDELIYELLHGIEDGDMPIERERERLAELMARRGSSGYGRGIASTEVLELLHRLEKCSNPSFTPSGAPIIAELTMDEVRAKLAKY